jgi:toxin FitB
VRFLLDTNVVSELRKGERCHPGVREWIRPVRSEDLHVSVLTIGELRRGVESLRRRDPPGARSIDSWLARLVRDQEDRILGVSREIAEEWGRLNVPDPLPAVDGLLAATARVHGLTLVTRNVADVSRTGVAYLNPFEA